MEEMNFGARFSTADYVVFGLMLVISAAIGVYYGFADRKNNTTAEFLMGGRAMKVFPVSLSILASFMSAITLLGTPAEIYNYGTQYCMIVVGYCLLIPVVAHVYLPIFYNLGITSAYEYLDLRFNRLVRTLGSSTFAIQMIVYMAIVLFAPSLALSQVTGMSVWMCVASIGVVCTFYTAVGGLKAVVLTDVFQVMLMFGAMFAVTFKGAYDVGGWEYIWKINKEGQRIHFLDFNPSPTVRHTLWTLIIGGYFTWVSVYAVNQAMVQRYLSIPTMKGAQIAIWINLFGLSLLLTICSLAGLVIYAKYHACDPKSAKLIKANDQLFPLFVMDTLGFLPGLPGLFVAGIFSGALSTVSSGVNSLAAVTLEDLVKSYIRPNISEKSATRLTKALAIFYGVLAIALVAVAERLGDVLQAALSSLGMFGGPVLGLFSLGMFFPWANSAGAAVGLVSGLGASFWIGCGSIIYKIKHPHAPISTAGCPAYFNVSQIMTNHTFAVNETIPAIVYHDECLDRDPLTDLYSLSYMYFCAVGCIVAVGVGLLVSCLTGFNDPKDIDPRLISPVFDILCPYLPAKIRTKLRFNVGANFKTLPKTKTSLGSKIENALSNGKSKTELTTPKIECYENKGFQDENSQNEKYELNKSTKL